MNIDFSNKSAEYLRGFIAAIKGGSHDSYPYMLPLAIGIWKEGYQAGMAVLVLFDKARGC